jgi:hypothetical protein
MRNRSSRADGYALIRRYGQISVEQRIEVMQKLLQDPSFAPGMPVLIDARQLEILPDSSEVADIATAQAPGCSWVTQWRS